MPFAERTALLEKGRQEYDAFIAWWKTATYEQRLAAVKSAKIVSAEEVANIADISSNQFLTIVLINRGLM
jgi:hypothetical protein